MKINVGGWRSRARRRRGVAARGLGREKRRSERGSSSERPPARSPSGSTRSACRWRSSTSRRIRRCTLNIVTYDGDGNGATTMQTKIQLWNRTGNGWPDVIFSEQANDPVWMGAEAVRLRAGPQDGLPEEPARRLARSRRSRSAPSTAVWSASRTTWPRRCCTSTRS